MSTIKMSKESKKIFIANSITITEEDYWQDVIELAFIHPPDQYISITRIPYEDTVYFEFGEQAAYCYANKVSWLLKDEVLSFEISCIKSSDGLMKIDLAIQMKDIRAISGNLNEVLGKLFLGLQTD